ncbi:MAG: hypothetical protein JWP88_1595 [Flaviaesturariibacter sp.]|nr:hypothetical protein [Flaviaesturariibacter sp.]
MNLRAKLLSICLMASLSSFSQGFNFSCARDTVISGCGASCITLQTIIPDLKGTTSNYIVTKIAGSGAVGSGCFAPYVEPNDNAGTSTNLIIDDRWTSVINIGFPFMFYGATYTQLVANTNGVVSFDLSKANGSANYSILSTSGTSLSASSGTGHNLPSSLYDKAVIFGPFHDLNPNYSTSPAKRIQYQVMGTAPHRRWVLSFYKVPLFNCSSSIENTQQIVLYEGTGIVEVFVFSKQICTSWNDGRAMIGMQDMTRTNGIMPPGRRASDPQWGSVNMNEAWRFQPASGTSLLKRVELYNLSGTLVSTGNTVSDGNGGLKVSFPNVCSPIGTTPYIIKPVYQKIDDATVEISGLDTVRITKMATGLAATATSTPSGCLPTGTISVSLPAGTTAPISYKLDNLAPQASSTFTGVSAGPHTVIITDGAGCSATLTVEVATPAPLQAAAVPTSTSCTGVANGKVVVTPQTGTAPFQYMRAGTNTWQASNTFTNLSPGPHVFYVSDASGCISNGTLATVSAGPPLTAASTKTDVLCFGGNTGTATLTLSNNATAPYTYSIDNFITSQTTPLITGLNATTHTLYFKDAAGCTGTATVVIGQPTQLAGAVSNNQMPLCNGASNGILTFTGSGGIAPYQYSLNNGTFGSSNTFNVGAGSYAAVVKDANGCTNPVSNIVVSEPLALSSVFDQAQPATCDGGADGVIHITALGGTTPYQYRLDSGAFQASPTFNVAPGRYAVVTKDANGCVSLTNVLIGLTNNQTYQNLPDQTICEGTSTTLTPVTNATVFAWSGTPLTTNNQSGSSVTVSPVVTTAYRLIATLGRCSVYDTVIVRVNPAPIPNAGQDNTICYGQSDTLAASGGVIYEWSPTQFLSGNNSLIGNLSGPDLIVNRPDKTTTYTLSVTDVNNCHSLVTDEVTISVTPPFKVQVNPVDTVGFIGDKIQITASSIANHYLWTFVDGSPATGLNNPAIFNPIIEVLKDETYKVTATTDAGCAGETYFSIKAYRGPDIYVATAFTPNGDGKNDRLRPFPVGVATLNYFRVFDRWGSLVYEYKGEKRGPVVFNVIGSNIGWDGRVNGKELSTGVYVWIAEGLTKEKKLVQRKGVSTLIR